MNDDGESPAVSLIDAAALTQEIGLLYQLPVGEFVSARNELARRVKKQDRDAATVIKELSKPSLSAWAANQVYWRARAVFDELIDAGHEVRTLQESMLAGTPVHGDLQSAMSAQRAAQNRALEIARQALADHGHKTSQTVIRRVTTTLEALATYGRAADAPPHGRLSEDVPARGFGAFAGLASPAPGADVTPLHPPARNQEPGTNPETETAPTRGGDHQAGKSGRVLAHPRAVERARESARASANPGDEDEPEDERSTANDNQLDRAAERRRKRAAERLEREKARREARRELSRARDALHDKEKALAATQRAEKEALDRMYESERAVAAAERELARATATRDIEVSSAERAKLACVCAETEVREAERAVEEARAAFAAFDDPAD